MDNTSDVGVLDKGFLTFDQSNKRSNNGCMSTATRQQEAPVSSRAARLAELLEQTMPTEDAEAGYLPVPEVLVDLLPGGGLRRGAATEVDDPHLALALLGSAAPLGFHAAIGLPEINWVAGEPYGLRLEQLLLVVDPQDRWADVLAALIPVVDTILLAPPDRMEPRASKRIDALLRRHGTVLLTMGHWPGSVLRLGVSDNVWHGLGDGHGLLAGREATITVTGRSAITRMRTARVWLPDGRGHIREGGGEAMVGGWDLAAVV